YTRTGAGLCMGARIARSVHGEKPFPTASSVRAEGAGGPARQTSSPIRSACRMLPRLMLNVAMLSVALATTAPASDEALKKKVVDVFEEWCTSCHDSSDDLNLEGEIGRASCRESVWVWGAARPA